MGVIGAVAVSEPVGDGAPGSEPEGVQEVSGVDGGGFDDGAFEPVDVEAGMEPAAGGGVVEGPGTLGDEVARSGMDGSEDAVGVEEGEAGLSDEGVLSDEVSQLLELVAGVVVHDSPGTGVVVVEEGAGEMLELGEVLTLWTTRSLGGGVVRGVW